jgi:REP element-mobilizing transposase RayT
MHIKLIDDGWGNSVQEDHIHMIIQAQPSESIAEVVQILKGGTSRAIRKEFPELEEFL